MATQAIQPREVLTVRVRAGINEMFDKLAAEHSMGRAEFIRLVLSTGLAHLPSPTGRLLL